MVERISFVLLALLTVAFGYNLLAAADRFGDAAATFDGVGLELIAFRYERGETDVELSIEVANGGENQLRVVAIEFPFVVNGVLAGGGDARPGAAIEPGDVQVFDLRGRITDHNYVMRQDPDQPLRWLVTARMLVSVDDRLDSVWQPFAFRAETP